MKIAIIGAGIGGMAAATLLSRQGNQVTVYEKNSVAGGRAGVIKEAGFTFDAGPSWYLMPEVFERYFQLVDENPQDYYELRKLSPAYKVFYDYRQPVTIFGDLQKDRKAFNSIEPGSGAKLDKYVLSAERTYKLAMDNFLYDSKFKPAKLARPGVISQLPKLTWHLSQSTSSYVGKIFRAKELQQILSYPMVFLGASPYQAPAMYHLMSYLDFKQGVYYPVGGISKVIEAIERVALKNKVKFEFDSNINKISEKDGVANGVFVNGKFESYDLVISNADLNFTENNLIKNPAHRSFTHKYWSKRVQGPSALLMYLGVKGALPQLEHHNLLFTKHWQENFDDIFKHKQWPKNPSIYVCKPSQTDSSVTKTGHENIFVLVPLPAKVDADEDQEEYASKIIDLMSKELGVEDLAERVVYKKLFGPADFESQYNSWQGSALGLAHTTTQSAMFRPGIKSKKLEGLYYVGANVQPGIGLPMCLISAELVSNAISESQL